MIYRWRTKGQKSRLVRAIRIIKIKNKMFMLIVELERNLPGVGIVPLSELTKVHGYGNG